jgi:hypothetical protein
MKLSGYHKGLGDTVELLSSYDNLKYDKIYLAKVFEFTKIPIDLQQYPHIEFNGTGFYYDKAADLPVNIEHHMPDYGLYQEDTEYYLDYSIGFTTRGCFRKCSFCVNKKYDKVHLHSPVEEFYDSSKKYLCLLDDNLLAYPQWKQVIESLIKTKKYFQFKQGLDIRLMTDEKAEVLSSVKYKGDYIFAFDHVEDSELISKKLELWRRYCSKNTKLYVFCGFDSLDERDIVSVFERIKILFKYQCLPYIMRYKNYSNSKWRGMYITIARWCNQPSIVKKMSFREFCLRDGGSAERYMVEFEEEFPQIARDYLDIYYQNLR